MPLITLSRAASEIKQAVDEGREVSGTSPFFFLVGAGISHPSIPLSSEIVEECLAVARRHGRDVQTHLDPMDRYSAAMQEAFPQPDRRRLYFSNLIKKARISHANFRLAHLLLKNSVASFVVTPNFDDLLTRALILFGEAPVVCEHPSTLAKIDLLDRDRVQVLHVHGTHAFYDCCNLKEEIVERGKPSTVTSFTVSGVLDNFLQNYAPLVIGYSGWSGDVIMSALERRLATPLKNKFYWFCYRRRHAEELPDWLKQNPNVSLVAPDETPRTADSEAAVDEPTQSASRVLEALLKIFECQRPDLTQDPLGFFATQLQRSFPRDEGEEDTYALQSVIDHVRRAKADFDQRVRAPAADSALEPMRAEIQRADMRAAIRLASGISLDLPDEQLREIAASMWNAGSSLHDDSAEELLSYDLVVTVSDRLRKLEQPDRERLAKALLFKGLTLRNLLRNAEAIVAFDEVVRRFGEAPEAALREQVARAMRNKGYTLGALNSSEEAIVVYDEVVRRFGEATEAALQEQVALALVNKSFRLETLNRNEEAIVVCDEVAHRFAGAEEAALRKSVPMALVNKGVALRALNRREEAIVVYDEVVRRFAHAPEAALREPVAKALVNKGEALKELNRGEEAIVVYDEVVRRFGEVVDTALREPVAEALVDKGIALESLNRGEDAIATYDEVIRKFDAASETEIKDRVSKARSRREKLTGLGTAAS